jgi:hypothetical protein
MAAKNELVADLLARAGDPEIRQAALKDAARLLRGVIGIGVLLDDMSGAADIDAALRLAQRRADAATAKAAEIERRATEQVAEPQREVAPLEERKAELLAAISIIEPTIAAGAPGSSS